MPILLPPDYDPEQNYSGEPENKPTRSKWFWLSFGIQLTVTLAIFGVVATSTISGIKWFIQQAEEASIPIEYPKWKFICDRKLKVCSNTYPSSTKPDGPEKIQIQQIRYIQTTYQRKRQGTEYYVNLLLASDRQVTGRTVQLNVLSLEEGKRLSKAISTFLQNPKQQKLEVIYTQGAHYLW